MEVVMSLDETTDLNLLFESSFHSCAVVMFVPGCGSQPGTIEITIVERSLSR